MDELYIQLAPITPVAISDSASSASRVAAVEIMYDGVGPILFMHSLLCVAVIIDTRPAELIEPSATNVAIPIRRMAISLCGRQVQHCANRDIITTMQFTPLCTAKNSHRPMQCVTISSVFVLTTVMNVIIVIAVHIPITTHDIASRKNIRITVPFGSFCGVRTVRMTKTSATWHLLLHRQRCSGSRSLTPSAQCQSRGSSPL